MPSLETQGKYAEAKEKYRKVLIIQPNFPAAANNLAYLLAGMALGRLDLSGRRVPVRLVAGGLCLAVIAVAVRPSPSRTGPTEAGDSLSPMFVVVPYPSHENHMHVRFASPG